jgi:hypothetical protein
VFYGIAAVVRLLESEIESADAGVDRAAVFMTLIREVRNGLQIVAEVEKCLKRANVGVRERRPFAQCRRAGLALIPVNRPQ